MKYRHLSHRRKERTNGICLPGSARTHTVTLIPGDGIGPEVTGAVVSILEATVRGTDAQFAWEPFRQARTLSKSTANIFRKR